jgi:hypothetical protein
MRRVVFLAIIAFIVLTVGAGLLQESTRFLGRSMGWWGQWVTTWSGATQPFVGIYFGGSLAPPPEFHDAYVNGVLEDQTIRIVVRSTLSGNRVRIRLSNQYGKQPLTIGAARIAKRGYEPVSEREILFGGQTTVVIPPGGVTRSDPVSFDTGDRGYMQVSLYVPGRTDPATSVSGETSAYVLIGNRVAVDPEDSKHKVFHLRDAYWLAGVEVYAAKSSKAILIIDDVGGNRNRLVENHGWQDAFKDRLLEKGGSDRFAVLDSSMSNCSLDYVCRVRVLERIMDAQHNRRGVKWVILSAGLMDLEIADAKLQRGLEVRPIDAVLAVIRAQKNVVDVVHAGGMKIYGVTYPRLGGREYSEDLEAMRAAVNTWIRGSGTFDAVADFDRALGPSPFTPFATPSVTAFAGPGQPRNLFMPGPSDYATVAANAFDLSAFRRI